MASAAFAQGIGQQVHQQVRAGLAPLTGFGASEAFTQAMGHQAQAMGHQAIGRQVQQQVRAGLAPLNGSRASAPLAQGGAQSAQGGFAQGGGTQLTQQARPQVFEAQLNPLNGSGASGSATLVRNGTTLRTIINSFGMAPNLPHAQHIHGMAQAISE